MLNLIVAMSQNRVIGHKNQLPWRLPDDLQYFKQCTQGATVIMGRKTYESIGRALPKRFNIIISRRPDYTAEDARVCHSLPDAITAAKQEHSDKPVFIIGGANVYEQCLNLIDRMYITRVEAQIEGDAFFPNINMNHWQLTKETLHPTDDKHAFAMRFQVWDRKTT